MWLATGAGRIALGEPQRVLLAVAGDWEARAGTARKSYAIPSQEGPISSV
ncbi:hypothetical protein [Mesorhizobium sp.]|nr:hypothetical protein [Mesorhizobium sp.]